MNEIQEVINNYTKGNKDIEYIYFYDLDYTFNINNMTEEEVELFKTSIAYQYRDTIFN
jgi:hypothetical protein